MRRYFALLMLASLPTAVSGQTAWQRSGTIATGVQQVENNTNSSKFSEYRDLEGTTVPFAFRFSAFNTNGWFVDAAGADLTRLDQRLFFTVGKPGGLRIDGLWSELPHNLSNKAVSPYTATAPGRLDVGQTMAIPFKKLATAAADAVNVVRSDSVAAAFAQSQSRPISLENHSRTGSVQLRYNGVKAVDLTAGFTRRTKQGSHLSYGPIGDRPPRTLNIQLAEPLDYVTGDFNAAAEYVQPRYQVRAEYLLSSFENEIDVLEWRNVWASPAAGSTFDTWDRAIGVWGRRPLAPDNKYQSATLSGGLALPLDSRLTATFARGMMEQDNALVPYAYHVDQLANSTLPRSTAEAKMNTTHFAAEYFIAPLPRVNLRAFYRRFDLDNETTASRWQYVTQDASNLNGSVSYKNKRQNLPIAWDRQNVGVETTLRFAPMRSSVVLGFEREAIDRDHRQVASMTENIMRASWRARPMSWLSFRTSYLRGDRDAGEYDWQSAAASYWYEATEADNDDPRNSFADHPDMRRFDMADRKRDRADFTMTLSPSRSWSLSSSLRYRRDDYDSNVTPVQPLLGLTVADREAFTPGDQLGLLRSDSRQLSADLMYMPGDRFAMNLSAGYDVGTSDTRSIEYNENNKKNPSTVATAALGPWTRATSQWTADFEDRTRYAGLGGTFDIVPGRIMAAVNYTMSLTDLDIDYDGFGVVNFDGLPFPDDHQFAFRSPETVSQKTHTAGFSLDLPLVRSISARVGWQFESYTIRDWQQEAATPQFEPVLSDLYLRDTSRSHQWGNRLLNMGSYLAPGYTGHVLHAGLTYQFGTRRLTP
jgi:MtrB/PioB family decaheme-associated outer membrane protein